MRSVDLLEGGQRNEAVTQRNTILVLHLHGGLLVELRDLHALRTVQGADAAEVAPLKGVVNGRSVTVTLALRAVVLRTGVERGGLGDRELSTRGLRRRLCGPLCILADQKNHGQKQKSRQATKKSQDRKSVV